MGHGRRNGSGIGYFGGCGRIRNCLDSNASDEDGGGNLEVHFVLSLLCNIAYGSRVLCMATFFFVVWSGIRIPRLENE
jgi:hypothetical protein